MIYCEKIRDYVDQNIKCIKCDCYDKEMDDCNIEDEDEGYIRVIMPDFTEN